MQSIQSVPAPTGFVATEEDSNLFFGPEMTTENYAIAPFVTVDDGTAGLDISISSCSRFSSKDARTFAFALMSEASKLDAATRRHLRRDRGLQ